MTHRTIEAGPQTRVRLDVSYDGTDFAGWARQPGQRTVQAELEAALTTVLRRPGGVPLTVAGRTDAGVHATGQVAHFDLPPHPGSSPLPDLWRPGVVGTHPGRDDSGAAADIVPQLVRRLAGVLAPDVRVRAARVVPTSFDARFSALHRRYEYRISDAEFGVEPARRRYVLARSRPLDVQTMAAAAAELVGLHDFVAFCRQRAGASTTRELQRLDVVREDAEIVCTVVADAFCHSMVRSLVGALLAVGDGRRPSGWPGSLLDRDRRADDVFVAPARGLTLVEISYPDDAGLAARAEQTRAKRT